jgi:phosphoribosylamine--glycine ligase
MRVLIVGGGGREHALAWKIAQSPLVDALYCAPGNPGISTLAECVSVPSDDLPGLLKLARARAVDLTIVGPEAPLIAGIVDLFKENGLRIFGPTREAAELEGSKVFSKGLMRQHAIPTAEAQTFIEAEAARSYVRAKGAPIVVKADGCAAGKGALVCPTLEAALDAVDRMLVRGEFGDAGRRILIEEFLTGQEASILALTDTKTIVPLETAQDHKPIFDGDHGPNTGGMGAYSPAPIVTPALSAQIDRDILTATVHAMNRERRPYRGVLYAGLMLTPGGPKVLEFNCRFGDPETQPLMVRLRSDLVPVLIATIEGRLDEVKLEWDPRPAVCVVVASGGYPGNYEQGLPITGVAEAEALSDVVVFHAATKIVDGQLVTDGGRVLGVTALGGTIAAARRRAYEAVERIHFKNAYHRRDIGAKALALEKSTQPSAVSPPQSAQIGGHS